MWSTRIDWKRINSATTFWPLLLFVAYAAVLFWKQHQAFAGFVVPYSDFAADDILIFEAKKFQLLHGIYSRFGFYHPGPLILQFAALGETLLYDWAHLFPTYIAAQAFTVTLLHGVAFAFALRLWLQVTGNIAVALAAVLLTIATISRQADPYVFLIPWAANISVAGATMVATGLAGILVRGPNWLPLLAFGAVMLINIHVSFISIVPGIFVAIVLAALIARRIPTSIGGATAGLRSLSKSFTSVAISAAIVTIGLMPIAINLVAHWPAELPKYLEVAGKLRLNQPIKVFRYIISFLPLYGAWILLFSSRIRPATEDQQQADIRFAAVSIFWSALGMAILFSFRGIDALELRFLLYWLTAFIGIAAAAVFVYLYLVFQRQYLRVVLTVAVVAVSAVPIAQSLELREFVNTQAIVEAARVLAEKAQPDRKIVLELDRSPEAWSDVWSETVGLIAVLNRQGNRSVCIDHLDWHLLFHARYRCDDTGNADAERLRVVMRKRAVGKVVAPLLMTAIIEPEKTVR